MSIEATISNLRKMRRSNAMRKESNPEEVARQLEAILVESVHMQNTGSKSFQLRALKELKQLRLDMTTGQINAGAKGGQYVGIFSHVIDQLERANSKADSDNAGFNKSMAGIRDAFPSTDSLVAALMTANPIMGYGVKIVRDITLGRRRAVEERKREAEQRLKAAKEQEALIKEKLDAINNPTEEEDAAANETNEVLGTYEALLLEIRDDIKLLESYWRGSEEKLDVIEETLNTGLSEVVDEVSNQTEEMIDAEARERREDSLSAMDDDRQESKLPTIDEIGTKSNGVKKEGGGLLEKLLTGPLAVIGGALLRFGGVIGAVLGAFGLTKLASVFKPLGGFTGFLGTLGKILRPFSKLAWPLAIITSIYDFFDGFLNAEEIMGKTDVDIVDRFIAGMANVVEGLVSMVDGILELFGIDLIDSDKVAENIVAWRRQALDYVYGLVETIVTTVMDFANTTKEWIVGKYEDALKVGDAISDVIDASYAAVTNGFVSIYESIANKIKTAINDSIKLATDTMNSIMDTFRNVYLTMENKVKSWRNGLTDIPIVGGFFAPDQEPIQPLSRQNDVSSEVWKNNADVMFGGSGMVMVPSFMSPSHSMGRAVTIAEQQMIDRQNQPTVPIAINAPTTTNSSITHVGSNNTSNVNPVHRRLSDGNFTRR